MNTTQQGEALPALIERFRGLHFDHAPDGWPAVRTREITALLDRITELESQLAQRFDAADMATASAQGFRDGVASLSANAGEPLVRYCPGCGSVGPVDGKYRDCCPDGGRARMIPEPLANQCRDTFQIAVRELLAAPPTAQAEGWQPIETAPKDGQAILVTDGRGCYCVEWNEEFDWWTVDDNKLGPFRLRGSAPTHWMPLPAAPGPADGESNE